MGCPSYGALNMVGSRSSGWVQRIADSANVETPSVRQHLCACCGSYRARVRGVVISYKNKYRSDYQDIVAGFLTLEEAGDQFGVFRLDTR